MTKKIVITGGPHTGKTTLFEALKDVYPKANFVPEPATSVIGRLGLGIIKEPCEFCGACMDYSVTSEALSADQNGLTILDRSMVDTVAYAKRDKCERLLPELYIRIAAARYSGALICDFVGDYTKTELRYENISEARATHLMISEAYQNIGIRTHVVPAMPLDDRVKFAVQYINTAHDS